MTTQLQRQLSIYQLINPVPILTEHKQCADRREHDFMCVQPTESENLLRIVILDSRQKRQHVVFCTGPLQEIYDEFFWLFAVAHLGWYTSSQVFILCSQLSCHLVGVCSSNAEISCLMIYSSSDTC